MGREREGSESQVSVLDLLELYPISQQNSLSHKVKGWRNNDGMSIPA